MAFTHGGESKASCFLERFLARSDSGAYSGSFGTSLEAATGSVLSMAWARGSETASDVAWDVHQLVASELHVMPRHVQAAQVIVHTSFLLVFP